MAANYIMPTFENLNPAFEHGFEMGLLWAVLAGPVDSAVEHLSYVLHRVNREIIDVIAERTGWTVVYTRASEPEWFTADFTRTKPRLAIVRPEGEG